MRARHLLRGIAGATAAGAVLAGSALLVAHGAPLAARSVPGPPPAVHSRLPVRPGYYFGVYHSGAPDSYAAIHSFAAEMGFEPRIASYYSGWYEPFQSDFARAAAAHGAVPLVQINPTKISLTDIAHGKYDSYLTAYALAVRAYDRPVIISFGHEMNGDWFSWGYHNAPPSAFVAAWRHIVTVFRGAGAENVTWLWTVNIIDARHQRIPDPAPWWPGRKYVTWIGIDGYYYKPTWQFAPLFGPTIRAVRALANDPVLIAETGAAPATDKAAKVADLFQGVRAYSLQGFVWFDGRGNRNWSISGPAAAAAFHRGVRNDQGPAS